MHWAWGQLLTLGKFFFTTAFTRPACDPKSIFRGFSGGAATKLPSGWMCSKVIHCVKCAMLEKAKNGISKPEKAQSAGWEYVV